jgi:hypothetical protein
MFPLERNQLMLFRVFRPASHRQFSAVRSGLVADLQAIAINVARLTSRSGGDRESPARGRSIVKMQRWSGEVRAEIRPFLVLPPMPTFPVLRTPTQRIKCRGNLSVPHCTRRRRGLRCPEVFCRVARDTCSRVSAARMCMP